MEGAQNFSKAMRIGCTLVSGIALGPDFASRRRASSLVKPAFEATFRVSGELVGAAPVVNRDRCVSSCLGSLVAEPNIGACCGSRADLDAIPAFAFATGVEFEIVTGSTLDAIARNSSRETPVCNATVERGRTPGPAPQPASGFQISRRR
jgi:hypothetical protein